MRALKREDEMRTCRFGTCWLILAAVLLLGAFAPKGNTAKQKAAQTTGARATPTATKPTAAASNPSKTLTISFQDEVVGAEAKSMPGVVGFWQVGVDGEKHVLIVDGRKWRSGQAAAGLADKARALYGERYAEFLDSVSSFAYYPYAVARALDNFAGGEISVRFKPIEGRVDQAGG